MKKEQHDLVEYWKNLEKKNYVILLDKTKYKHLANWHESDWHGRQIWLIVSSDEVKTWLAENMKREFKIKRLEVRPEEVPNGVYLLEKTNKWLGETSNGSIRPKSTLSRFVYIFEDEVDMILFKMRWY